MFGGEIRCHEAYQRFQDICTDIFEKMSEFQANKRKQSDSKQIGLAVPVQVWFFSLGWEETG